MNPVLLLTDFLIQSQILNQADLTEQSYSYPAQMLTEKQLESHTAFTNSSCWILRLILPIRHTHLAQLNQLGLSRDIRDPVTQSLCWSMERFILVSPTGPVVLRCGGARLFPFRP